MSSAQSQSTLVNVMDFLSIEEIERARAVLADPCPQPILEAGRVMLANAKDKTTAERRRREDVLTAASSAASPVDVTRDPTHMQLSNRLKMIQNLAYVIGVRLDQANEPGKPFYCSAAHVAHRRVRFQEAEQDAAETRREAMRLGNGGVSMLAERLSNLTIVESKAKALYDEARLMNEFDRALRARNNAVEDVVTAMKWNLNESVSAAATGQQGLGLYDSTESLLDAANRLTRATSELDAVKTRIRAYHDDRDAPSSSSDGQSTSSVPALTRAQQVLVHRHGLPAIGTAVVPAGSRRFVPEPLTDEEREWLGACDERTLQESLLERSQDGAASSSSHSSGVSGGGQGPSRPYFVQDDHDVANRTLWIHPVRGGVTVAQVSSWFQGLEWLQDLGGGVTFPTTFAGEVMKCNCGKKPIVADDGSVIGWYWWVTMRTEDQAFYIRQRHDNRTDTGLTPPGRNELRVSCAKNRSKQSGTVGPRSG